VKFIALIYTDPKMMDALPEGRFDAMMRDCLAYADGLRRDGRLIDSQMLEQPAAAKSARVRNGRRVETDGPFAEAKEVLGGFNLLEAENMDEAMRLAAGFPWASVGCVEVRPVQDMGAMRARVGAPAAPALEMEGASRTA